MELIRGTPEGYSEFLSLLLEAYTQFDEMAYRASFLLGWTLIESLLIERWKEVAKKCGKVKIGPFQLL